MSETLNLEVTEDGKVVSVVTTTQIDRVLLSSKELKRQIDQHQAIIDSLQPQYDKVLAFEQENNLKDEDELQTTPEEILDEEV